MRGPAGGEWHPMAVHTRTAATRLLLVHGPRVEFRYRYESWVQMATPTRSGGPTGAAFRATLEELADASLLLHVVDAATADCERRIEAVRRVLRDIGIEAPEGGEGEALARQHGGIAVSALRRVGLGGLLARAERLLWKDDEAWRNRLGGRSAAFRPAGPHPL